MANTIKCDKCGNEIEVSQALTHQIQEEVILREKENLEKEAKQKAQEEFAVELKKIKNENEDEKYEFEENTES